MKYKRFFVSLFICTIIALNMCPFFCTPVYAADNWQNVTTNAQLVQAFHAYCKSRDLTIEGSFADGVTSFTTQTFNNICNSIGIDVTALQAHLKYETDGNSGLKFLFDQTGITAYNAIFAQFLQDNNLSVGDSANQNDNILFSGESFTDDEGNTCLIFELRSGSNNALDSQNRLGSERFLKYGTYLKYSPDTIVNLIDNNGGGSTTLTFHINNNTYNPTFKGLTYNGIYSWCADAREYSVKQQVVSTGVYTECNGCVSVCKVYPSSSQNYKLILGVPSWNTKYYQPTGNAYYGWKYIAEITDKTNVHDGVTIYLTTNNTVINNNNYEGDTIINNDGTPDDDGGGGGNNDDDNWNPTNPTIPDYNGGGGSNNTINWPSIDIPDFNINFSLGNITEKFPFSIPFDLIALLTVLDGEPKAPDLDITIPLIVTDWHFEADFSQFDDLAQLIRAFEFIGFCVYLLYFTVGLVKG